jgi:4-diphosphocytidyl-2-C-methyl-D-erythritol kinase
MKKTLARACTIIAPCKINLHLSIGEKRPDGFHELESLFAPLDFHDSLRLDCGGKDGDCSLETKWDLSPEGIPSEIPPEIPAEKNLVSRAVSLFRERTGFKSGLSIHLDKRVPVGAGLGGGSSDAASCLLALNALADDAIPMEELKKMAAVLGSDAPFFLNRGSDNNICPPDNAVCPSAAFVGGRGEIVRPLKTPQGLWVLLAKPGFSSDTAGAFRLLDKTREQTKAGDRFHLSPGEMSLLACGTTPADVLVKALEGAPETWPFYNDFLPVFLEPLNFTTEDTEDRCPADSLEFHGVKKSDHYRTILTSLKDAGAAFAGLSGAGSCCFGVFRAKEIAEEAEKKLRIPGNFVKLTFFLAQKTIPVLE